MSVIKNYIYNTVYQVMTIFIPLITMPYLTRIFTPDQLGINTYTLSVVNYFTLFGMLGMALYGNRQIAYVRDNREKRNETFWSLYATQLITCTIALVLYYGFVYFYIGNNLAMYLIQGLNIISVAIDITWLFKGLEDFKKVVTRNTIAKILGVICIFIFIKTPDDLLKYTFLSVAVNIISTVIMWIYVPKYVGKMKVNINIIKQTIKPLLKLFLPQIATQVYGMMDKTMLGSLSTKDQVAFYEYSQKIIRMVLALINSIGVVMMPRVANIIGKGKRDEVPALIEKTFKFVSYVSIPMAFGLMGISKVLISWFLGEEYLIVGNIISISSIVVIAVSWANIIGVQYLIAIKKENIYTLSIIIAAIVNVVMNIFLLNKYGAYAAAISLIVAEVLGISIQLFLVRKQLNVRKMLLSVLNYFIAGITMFICIIKLDIFIHNAFLCNIIQVIIGIIIYIGLIFIVKDEVQKELIKKVKVMLSTRKRAIDY